MGQKKAIPIHLIGGSNISTERMASCQETVMQPNRKLRLLRPFCVTFIRGSRDSSPWREAGRRHLLGREKEMDRRVWNDRLSQWRKKPSR